MFPLDSWGRFRWNEFARLHFTGTTERPALVGGFFISGVFASPRKLTNQRDASRRVTANLGLIRLIREEAFGRRATPQRRSLSILVVAAETQGFSVLHWLFRDEVAKAINEMQAALGVKPPR